MFLVRYYGHIDIEQSFARIAQADAAQIARLPGFGPKKVARLKDAFERPFRTSTTSALAPAMTTSAPSTSTAAAVLSTEREIDTEPRTTTAAAPAAAISQEQRRLSPVWDIELDLNSPSPEPTSRDDPPTRSAAAAAGSSKRPRGVSAPWDIELGDADDDFGGPAASILGGSDHGVDGETGAAVMNTNVNIDVDDDHVEDVDVDMGSDTDLAPALRAKRRRA